MTEINKVLEIALNEVGYLEKLSNNNLDDKTANAGDKNYTKYARDMDNLNVYNGPKQGYSWCDIFIDWCFVQAFGKQRATELLVGWSAGCVQDWNWLKSAGRIVTNPQAGDLIFFNNLNHIGIVEYVDTEIHTIEGNTSNKAELIVNGGEVARKTYNKNSSYIYGYARPNYSENAEINIQEQQDTYSLIKIGCSNDLVRIAQNKLIKKGYILPKYGADGSFGEETEKAVKELQRDAHIDVDGIIGDNTWEILNGDFIKPTMSYPGYLIKKNQISDNVKKIQEKLIQLGFSCGVCGADGIFGNNTYNAVLDFQKSAGISADGIVGDITWNKLFN